MNYEIQPYSVLDAKVLYKLALFSGKYPKIEEKLRLLFSDYPNFSEDDKAKELAWLNHILDVYHQVLKPLREQRLSEKEH